VLKAFASFVQIGCLVDFPAGVLEYLTDCGVIISLGADDKDWNFFLAGS
jgi:hypothetical protein